jgi:hypothetical protein
MIIFATIMVLAAALSDTSGEGFALVGQELLLPIKAIVDYEGWSRKVYRPRSLEQGELFRIAKDVRSSAYIVGQDGQSVESRLFVVDAGRDANALRARLLALSQGAHRGALWLASSKPLRARMSGPRAEYALM